MVQQVTIVTDTTVEILPLIRSAIQTTLGVLTLGLERTRQRLHAFEEQYQLSSLEFESRFNAGAVGDTFDFIEWAGELKTYHLLEAQYQALQNAQLN